MGCTRGTSCTTTYAHTHAHGELLRDRAKPLVHPPSRPRIQNTAKNQDDHGSHLFVALEPLLGAARVRESEIKVPRLAQTDRAHHLLKELLARVSRLPSRESLPLRWLNTGSGRGATPASAK